MAVYKLQIVDEEGNVIQQDDITPIEQVNVEVSQTTGEASGSASYGDGVLDIHLQGIKGETGEQGVQGEQGEQGEQGVQGDSAVFDPSTGNIAVIKQTTGDDANSPMSQKAVTEELDLLEGEISLCPTVSDDSNEPDLDVADESGNVIMRLQGGQVRTKNFNSFDIGVVRDGTDKDLDFADDAGNVVLRIGYGHIRTKNFNSAPLQGKKVSFIGDSISTFEGYPGSNPSFYKASNAAITGVYTVDDTWWKGLCDMQGATVNRLFAYSGGNVVGNLCLNYDKLFSDGTSGAAPDCIFILAGINDWGNEKTLGTIDDEPASNTTFYAAYKYLLGGLITTYPNAKIIALTMLNGMSQGASRPLKNELGVYHAYFCRAIKDCCDLYAVSYIDLNKLVNINEYNYTSVLADSTHPKKAGIELMKKVINQSLTNLFI